MYIVIGNVSQASQRSIDRDNTVAIIVGSLIGPLMTIIIFTVTLVVIG